MWLCWDRKYLCQSLQTSVPGPGSVCRPLLGSRFIQMGISTLKKNSFWLVLKKKKIRTADSIGPAFRGALSCLQLSGGILVGGGWGQCQFSCPSPSFGWLSLWLFFGGLLLGYCTGSFWGFLSPLTDRQRREYESPAILAVGERKSQSRVSLWDCAWDWPLPQLPPLPCSSVCPGALPG